jgi:hypothetical protein
MPTACHGGESSRAVGATAVVRIGMLDVSVFVLVLVAVKLIVVVVVGGSRRCGYRACECCWA